MVCAVPRAGPSPRLCIPWPAHQHGMPTTPTALCIVALAPRPLSFTEDCPQHSRRSRPRTHAGYGTLDETLEITTWQQLGFHTKPVGLLNINGFFNKLLAFLDHATQEVVCARACVGVSHGCLTACRRCECVVMCVCGGWG